MATEKSKTEFTIRTLQVYGNQCMGCVRHKKDVMISYQTCEQLDKFEITDLFLNTVEATYLRDKLNEILARNENSNS